jgi:hypothetical protein
LLVADGQDRNKILGGMRVWDDLTAHPTAPIVDVLPQACRSALADGAWRRCRGKREHHSHQLERHLRTAANGASGTLGAEFNFWGTQEMLVIDGRTIGDIGFGPYLAESDDDAHADLLVLSNADWRATRTPVW